MSIRRRAKDGLCVDMDVQDGICCITIELEIEPVDIMKRILDEEREDGSATTGWIVRSAGMSGALYIGLLA